MSKTERGQELSSQENKVLELLSQALPTSEIAKRLHLSPNTVNHHVQSILTKTGLRRVDFVKGLPDQAMNINKTLGDREAEIVRLVLAKKSTQQIADELGISVHTVSTHKRNIKNKLTSGEGDDVKGQLGFVALIRGFLYKKPPNP